MPDALTPPAEAAHDANALLIWFLGIVIAGFGLLWWRFLRVTDEKDQCRLEQIAFSEKVSTLLSETRSAMVESRKSDDSMKAAMYELRDKVSNLLERLNHS